jgi:type III restriction enzyme
MWMSAVDSGSKYGERIYTPDWAVVYKQQNGEVRLYFIVETKFVEKLSDLPKEQQDKIRCGREHFKAVAKTTKAKVHFGWVNSYDDFTRNAMIKLND